MLEKALTKLAPSCTAKRWDQVREAPARLFHAVQGSTCNRWGEALY